MNEDQNPEEELNPEGANLQDGHQEDALDAQIIGEDQDDFDSPDSEGTWGRGDKLRSVSCHVDDTLRTRQTPQAC